MRPGTRRLALAAVVAVLASGCGEAAITDEASAALESLVDATWDAAEAADVEAARGRLDELRARAQELHEGGELDERRLAAVLAAADEVEDRLGVLEGAEPEPQQPADDDGDDDGGDDGGDDDGDDRERDEEEREEAEEEREEEREEAEEQREEEDKEAEKARKKAEKQDDD